MGPSRSPCTWRSTRDMATLLPMDSNIDDNIWVLDVVYDGLVRYDPETTEPYPYVAESIETTDNQVWTITIKPDLTFQNGEPVDAEAFARAWNYAAYGPNAMANNYFFERFEGYDAMQGETDDEGNVTVEPEADTLSGLTVVDPLTLEVTLNGPFAGFSTMLGYTGFFPIAQACLDDIAACSVQPIGNGPFQVDEWEQGVSMTASKWADYTLDETPNYDVIEWTEYAGASSWPDFLAGDLDTSAPPPAEQAAAEADADLQSRYVERPGAALTYLGFPLYLGAPWDNIEFRKAISMAIDRQGIIDALIPGQEVPADSWVVPGGVPGGEAGTCEWCTFDPEAAVAALEAAGGWPEGETLVISLGQDDDQRAVLQGDRRLDPGHARHPLRAQPDAGLLRQPLRPRLHRPVPQQLVPRLPAQRELPRAGVRLGQRRGGQHQLRVLQRRLRGGHRRRRRGGDPGGGGRPLSGSRGDPRRRLPDGAAQLRGELGVPQRAAVERRARPVQRGHEAAAGRGERRRLIRRVCWKSRLNGPNRARSVGTSSPVGR